MTDTDVDSLLRSFHRTEGFPGLPGDWEASSGNLENATRTGNLFTLFLRKKAVTSRRALIVVHGQGEHCGRYLHLPKFLDPAITDVCLFDLRGHGRSEGLRGHVEKFDEYTEDLAVFIAFAREKLSAQYGAAPEMHLFGHSMGGLITLRLLITRPEIHFPSSAITAPLLGLKMPVPGYKKALGYALSSVWGSLQLGSALDYALLSHDVNVQKAYANDLLVHDKATPRFFTEFQKAMADTLKHIKGFETPLLFMIPMQDGIVDAEVAVDYAKAIQDKKKDLITYPEFRHEVLNETGKEQAFEDLKKWILSHSTKKT